MTYFNQILHTNTFFIIETGMLNGGSALPFLGVGVGGGILVTVLYTCVSIMLRCIRPPKRDKFTNSVFLCPIPILAFKQCIF